MPISKIKKRTADSSSPESISKNPNIAPNGHNIIGTIPTSIPVVVAAHLSVNEGIQ